MRDIERAEPELYAAWRRAGAAFRFPEGESLLEQQQRVTAALAGHPRAPARCPRWCVCHGGSIRVMLCARGSAWAGRLPRVRGPQRGGGIAVRRLPVAAFVALVIATVGAFFVTQHLKVTTPAARRSPGAPPGRLQSGDGRTCLLRDHEGVRVPTSFRRTQISFYLLHRADDVDVAIVDPDDDRRRHARLRPAHVDQPPRRVHLGRANLHGRDRSATGPTTSASPWFTRDARSSFPTRRSPCSAARHGSSVTGVSPSIVPAPGVAAATATFTGAGSRRPRVLIYRTDVPGQPVLVKSYNATSRRGRTLWNGTLTGGAPAPQGTYLVGLRLDRRGLQHGALPGEPASRPRLDQPRRGDRALPRRPAADDPGAGGQRRPGRRRRSPAQVPLGAAARGRQAGAALRGVAPALAPGAAPRRRLPACTSCRCGGAPTARSCRSSPMPRRARRPPGRGCSSSCRRSPGRGSTPSTTTTTGSPTRCAAVSRSVSPGRSPTACRPASATRRRWSPICAAPRLPFDLTTDLGPCSSHGLSAITGSCFAGRRALAAGVLRLAAEHVRRGGRPRAVAGHRLAAALGDRLRRPGARPEPPARHRRSAGQARAASWRPAAR